MLEIVSAKKSFTIDEARSLGKKLGITWDQFDAEQFRKGLDVELEHGRRDTRTNVTDDDPLLTAKIAWAHLLEFPDYYDRLEQLEEEAKAFWKKK